jgi:hypothetical protein
LIPLTLSLGVTVRDEGIRVDATTLLHAADQALYKAKHAGRNRVELGALSPSPSKDHLDNGIPHASLTVAVH